MENSEKMLDVAEPTTDEVEETTAVPEEKTETNDNVEFTDGSNEESKENLSDAETDVESTNVGKQSKEDNSNYASIRRKAEAEAELKSQVKVKEAYEKGRLEAYIGKINPYTNTVIKDKADVQVYENMYALEQAGKDPISDYSSYVANKQREDEKHKEEQIKLQQEAENDIAEFTKKYPNVNLTELFEDEVFKDYIEGKRKPLTTLYEKYQKMENNFRNKAIDVAKQTIANSQSTPGALGNGSDVIIDYSNMSSEEFQKIVKKVIDGEIK
ncbi:MAG: hypothetical protein HFI86_02190 [Bacilli bacterium]|nr:hypothetical protein [Bacilli bacterium]